jgi:hypothetical protein
MEVKMAYEEILTVNSSIQSKRTTKATANSSTEVLKDGELLIVRDGNNPPNLRAGDGNTQIKNLKDMVPGVASTSTAGLMSASDKTKLNGIATGANKTIVDSALSSSSTNPVQNKIVNAELEKKLPLSGGVLTGNLTISKKANPFLCIWQGTDEAGYVQINRINNVLQMGMGFGPSKNIAVTETGGLKLSSAMYGPTLPDNLVADQVFFQTAGSNFVLDNVYPIGAVYMSMNSTNPGTLFGGTWEQVQGKFLLGVSNAYPAGSSGGESEHTLTRNEIPDHTHSFKYSGQSVTTGVNSIRLYQAASNQYNAYSGGQSSNCGGQAHNNMPPYLAVYIWYRTN